VRDCEKQNIEERVEEKRKKLKLVPVREGNGSTHSHRKKMKGPVTQLGGRYRDVSRLHKGEMKKKSKKKLKNGGGGKSGLGETSLRSPIAKGETKKTQTSR